MIVPEINNEIVYKIITNIGANKIIFSGSISDYFIYEKYGIKPNFNIKDVDVVIYSQSTLKKLEEIFGLKAEYKGFFNTKIFVDYNQYHIFYGGCMIDIFLSESNSLSTEIVEYFGHEISYCSILERIDILHKAIQHEYGIIPLKNTRQFKHIQKLMVYNEILNG